MSKTVTIPADGTNPFVVVHNGVKYTYKPGATVTVSDGVALEIEEYKRWRSKYFPEEPAQIHVQPDLSQNDPSAADYVKGRTHWVEEGETVLVDQTINGYEHSFDSPIPLVEGKSYTVEYNGTTYECIAGKNFLEEVCIGNLAPFSNEYPFTLTPGFCNTNDDPASIRVSTFGEKVKTLDSKFLPVASRTEYGVVTLNNFLEYALPKVTLEVGVTKYDDYYEKAQSALWINSYVNWRNYFAPFGGIFSHSDENANANRVPALSNDGKVTNLILTWGEDGILESAEESDA